LNIPFSSSIYFQRVGRQTPQSTHLSTVRRCIHEYTRGELITHWTQAVSVSANGFYLILLQSMFQISYFLMQILVYLYKFKTSQMTKHWIDRYLRTKGFSSNNMKTSHILTGHLNDTVRSHFCLLGLVSYGGWSCYKKVAKWDWFISY